MSQNTLNTKMTAIADEIRELSGTTEAMGLDAMATHVGEANDEVSSQAELLAQIASALEGKAGGSDTNEADSLITMTMNSYTNDRVTSIGQGAFAYATLQSVNFPAATYIGSSAFRNCSQLTTANFPEVTTLDSYAFYSVGLTTASFPNATTIGMYAFGACPNLTTVNFPAAITIGSSAFIKCGNRFTTVSFPVATTISEFAFAYCSGLTTASFPNITTIHSSAFYDCEYLTSLYLTGSSVCTLSSSGAFSYTPIAGYSVNARKYGSIYVPASLLTSYKNATNWIYFSNRFVGI